MFPSWPCDCMCVWPADLGIVGKMSGTKEFAGTRPVQRCSANAVAEHCRSGGVLTQRLPNTAETAVFQPSCCGVGPPTKQNTAETAVFHNSCGRTLPNKRCSGHALSTTKFLCIMFLTPQPLRCATRTSKFWVHQRFVYDIFVHN
jgi:hypothetical protein